MAAKVNIAAQSEPKNAGELPPELMALHDKLDSLWERYLNLLDTYQVAQKELQKQMSSGFFSLAQANFKSPNRRRYGQDFYDERVKATRRCHVAIRNDDSLEVVVKRAAASSDDSSKPTDATESEKEAEKPEPQQQPSPPGTPTPESEDANATDPQFDAPGNLDKKTSASQASSPAVRDPLYWFGILVPRELCSAQASFSIALDESVTQAANAARGMREIEAEIRRVRKAVRKAEKAAGA